MTFSNIGMTMRPARRVIEGRMSAGPAWLLLLLATALPIFWDGLVSVVEAWSKPEYSHGPIIPLLSAYLFLREMRFVPAVEKPVRDRWQGLLVIALGYVIAGIGNKTSIPEIVTYGLIVWIFGVILTLFGFRRGWVFWPAVLHLVFMLPLPQVVYWQVNTTLQLISSEIGVAIIRAMDIPVYLDGNVIDLGTYQLLVAEACSGLRYLFPIMSFSYVFCVLYQGPRWHKAVILLSAVPIAVLMNSFRVGMIGVLVNYQGIEAAEGFLHYFEGWIIFGACIAVLFGLAVLMQRLSPNPKPLSSALDIDFSGLRGQLARFRFVPATAPLLLAAGATALLSLSLAFSSDEMVERVERKPFVLFPMRFGEWEGLRAPPLDHRVEKVLAADDYLNVVYQNGDAPPIDFFSAFYFDQGEGQGIHSPEVCLPGGGWEIAQLDQKLVELPAESGVAPFEVNRAIIQNGDRLQLVYYWFEQRGRRMTSDYLAKASVVWDSLFMSRQDGALVRLITPIDSLRAQEEGDRRLQGFMSRMMPDLPRFIPGASPPA